MPAVTVTREADPRSDRSGRTLENCDMAVHKIGKGRRSDVYRLPPLQASRHRLKTCQFFLSMFYIVLATNLFHILELILFWIRARVNWGQG